MPQTTARDHAAQTARGVEGSSVGAKEDDVQLVPIEERHFRNRFGYIAVVMCELGRHDRLHAACTVESKLRLLGCLYPIDAWMQRDCFGGCIGEELDRLFDLDLVRREKFCRPPLHCERSRRVVTHDTSRCRKQHHGQQGNETSKRLHGEISSRFETSSTRGA